MNNKDITADEAYKNTLKSLDVLKNKEYESVSLDIELFIAKGMFKLYRTIEYIETISRLRRNGFKVEPFFDNYEISWDKRKK